MYILFHCTVYRIITRKKSAHIQFRHKQDTWVINHVPFYISTFVPFLLSDAGEYYNYIIISEIMLFFIVCSYYFYLWNYLVCACTCPCTGFNDFMSSMLLKTFTFVTGADNHLVHRISWPYIFFIFRVSCWARRRGERRLQKLCRCFMVGCGGYCLPPVLLNRLMYNGASHKESHDCWTNP